METLHTLAALPAIMVNVLRLLFHSDPHTDEMIILAFRRIFRKKVDARFPGFSRAKIELWSLGQAFELAPEDTDRVVAIGTGRQLLDEHETSAYEDTCAAEIFAHEVGILDDPAVALMIETVKSEDRHGARSGSSIHSVLKKIHRLKNPMGFQTIINWCVWAYVAEYHALKKAIEKSNGKVVQPKVLDIARAKKNISAHFGEWIANRWFALAERTMAESNSVIDQTLGMLVADKAKAKSKFWSTFGVWDGEREVEYSMLAIELEDFNYYVPTAVRRMMVQDQPDVMIIKQPNGHLAIMSHKDDIDLTFVARALRIQELKVMMCEKPKFTVEELSVQGGVHNWPKAEAYWHLHEKEIPNQLYCGAESAPSAPGSQIPFGKICRLVKDVMANSFHGNFWRSCQDGFCAGSECPFFGMYMPMCMKVRRTFSHQVAVRV